ncbi:hypothetical protein [Roseospira navarrensis]|uniref:Uncharacterized protein n=1 Tax=Roseospira navarrensis TaxID=140058 RepID=A0A7X1ZFT5_9PROT|nr:hypothetical protein [Roseospira navarrensis]MQX37783.1 hypothetical protein [Roseospira navarrensis]
MTTLDHPRIDYGLIDQAHATAGGHLSIGRGGYTLCFAEGATLSGYHCKPMKAACIGAGLPVIDSRPVPFDAVVQLVVHGPMIAVGRPVSAPPWHGFAYAPLLDVARAYAEAGAEVYNVPGLTDSTIRRR